MSWNSFKISDDPLFIEKVRDIVGLYLNPPDHAVVLSFDEKPQIQALERAQPILPMDMGRPEARSSFASCPPFVRKRNRPNFIRTQASVLSLKFCK